MKDFLRFNKISTGIEGLDRLLYGGLVIPENENVLVVIRGGDNTEKTIFSMQVLHALASRFTKEGFARNAHYLCNYLSRGYLEDLFLDMFVASGIRKLTTKMVEGQKIDGSVLTDAFFDMENIYCSLHGKNKEFANLVPMGYYQKHADSMLCNEALYYSNRTNALHLRVAHQDENTSNIDNAVFLRKLNLLTLLNGQDEHLEPVESLLDEKFAQMKIANCLDIDACLDTTKSQSPNTAFVCVNLADKRLERGIGVESEVEGIIDALSKFKFAILVVRDGVVIPEEKVGMLIELSTNKYESSDYLLNYLSIEKSRFQSSALHTQQYKRRDYGIEVYPSLHLYCQQRRYLQRALVYTHSNVISETFQQYLDKLRNKGASYIEYVEKKDRYMEACYEALDPTAGKNVTLATALDTMFIKPQVDYGKPIPNQDFKTQVTNEFLYANHGLVTAVIGEPNTYKRFLTYGGAFSSAHSEEHTLFLLLNKNDKIVRRRLQCPAFCNKRDTGNCKQCYQHMHFMNITLGCITPAEFLYYLLQQMETSYCGKKIKRVIIDDLQIVEYCFPFLFKDTLFLPALVDACRDRGIALYIMCDKKSRLCDSLRTEADNVLCTQRSKKGELELFVERAAVYSPNSSKIYSGKVSEIDKLFTCYEVGSKQNKKSIFGFNYDEIETLKTFSLSDYWKF